MDISKVRLALAQQGLDPDAISRIAEMCEAAAARQVGEHALENSIVYLYSKKNGAFREMESHTVERLYAYQLELDSDVLGYFTQVLCKNIVRERYGRRHVSSFTVDFLVIRKSSVDLVECKPLSAVESLIQKKPEEWVRTSTKVSNPVLEKWADAIGANFTVWVQPSHFSVELRNLEFLYANVDFGSRPKYEAAVLNELRKGPASLHFLRERISGLMIKDIGHMLATALVYGPISSTPIDNTESFWLTTDVHQAQILRDRTASSVDQLLRQSDDRLSKASKLDIDKGIKRLTLVRQVIAGTVAATERLKPLVRSVLEADRAGTNALEVCITNYQASGNRTSRLDEIQAELLSGVCKRWQSGNLTSFGDAYSELSIACRERKIEPPSKTTLRKRLEATSAAKRALAQGGKRAYQAISQTADPRSRSAPPSVTGIKIQIDSTKVDNKVFPGIEDKLLLEAPVLYVAVDCHSSAPAASSLIFGPARRDGLAILLRDYVARHGCLPSIIQIDRGPENRSSWLRKFCEHYRITLIINPAAKSRSNGQVENLLGRVNGPLERLPGGTYFDKKGRSADGRFKSRRTAALQFRHIRKEVDQILYEDISNLPLANGFTPLEIQEESIRQFGMQGTPCPFDEDFRFQTSIKTDVKKAGARGEVHHGAYRYTSRELLVALRSSEISEVRRDCQDSSLLRVQTTSGRYRAWSSIAPLHATDSEIDIEFRSYYLAQLGKQKAEIRQRIAENSYARRSAMVSATQHPDLAKDDAAAAVTEQQAPLKISPPRSTTELIEAKS